MMDGLREFVRIVLFGSALVGAAACGGRASAPASQPAQAQAPSPGTQPMTGEQKMASMCPMMVPGTRVTSEDIEGGTAMVFTTTSGDVADLRARARRMAEMHNQMGQHMMGPGMHGGMHGGEGMHGGGEGMQSGMMMVASDATVVDIEGGARMELRPRDPAQLDELRAQTRKHSQRMASGQCPMMRREAGGGHAHG